MNKLKTENEELKNIIKEKDNEIEKLKNEMSSITTVIKGIVKDVLQNELPENTLTSLQKAQRRYYKKNKEILKNKNKEKKKEKQIENN